MSARLGKPWSREVWKIIAILALASSVIMAAVGIYVVLAFKANIDVVAHGAPICLAGMRDYDSIAAAQAIGRLDLVSFLLTTGGILLGLFSLIGFWIIRREAMEEARDAALEEVRRVMQMVGLDENGGRTYISSGANPAKRARAKPRKRAPQPKRPEDISTAGAVRERPGEDHDDTEGGA